MDFKLFKIKKCNMSVTKIKVLMYNSTDAGGSAAGGWKEGKFKVKKYS